MDQSLSHFTNEVDYMENGGKKASPTSPKHQYHVSDYGGQDCNANSKKNRDCYRYPSLSNLVDEL